PDELHGRGDQACEGLVDDGREERRQRRAMDTRLQRRRQHRGVGPAVFGRAFKIRPGQRMTAELRQEVGALPADVLHRDARLMWAALRVREVRESRDAVTVCGRTERAPAMRREGKLDVTQRWHDRIPKERSQRVAIDDYPGLHKTLESERVRIAPG